MATEKKERCFERYNNGHLIEGPHLLFRPVMYTPLTRIADSWFSQAGKRCAEPERIFMRCAYQVSRKQAPTACAKEMEDFDECLFRRKQYARYVIIQKERMKQGKFEEAPDLDTYTYHVRKSYAA